MLSLTELPLHSLNPGPWVFKEPCSIFKNLQISTRKLASGYHLRLWQPGPLPRVNRERNGRCCDCVRATVAQQLLMHTRVTVLGEELSVQ